MEDHVDANIKYVSQQESLALDLELMDPNTYAYSSPQLMELAGLSVAHCVIDAFPLANRILVLCGPGNNGGDGLVAARHLHHFNRSPTIYVPRPFRDSHVLALLKQCEMHEIPKITSLPLEQDVENHYDLICDAIFGFSFKVPEGATTPIRAPYDSAISMMVKTSLPIISVDVPSGWHVEDGPTLGPEYSIQPKAVISLTSPKLCMRGYQGQHYLGGLFVPSALVRKYDLRLPKYPPASTFIRLFIPK